jgi:hypothetical protein
MEYYEYIKSLHTLHEANIWGGGKTVHAVFEYLSSAGILEQSMGAMEPGRNRVVEPRIV